MQKSVLIVASVIALLTTVICGCSKSITMANAVFPGVFSPAKKIQKIVYIETGQFGPTEQYTIDLKNTKITYEYSDSPRCIEKTGYKKIELSQEITQKIVKKLEDLTGEQWKDVYSYRGCSDGTNWLLFLIFSDGSGRRIVGDNAWPKDFYNSGIPAVQMELGSSYEFGRGVKKDLDEAIEWYAKASKNGTESAKEALKRLKVESRIRDMNADPEDVEAFDLEQYFHQ